MQKLDHGIIRKRVQGQGCKTWMPGAGCEIDFDVSASCFRHKWTKCGADAARRPRTHALVEVTWESNTDNKWNAAKLSKPEIPSNICWEVSNPVITLILGGLKPAHQSEYIRWGSQTLLPNKMLWMSHTGEMSNHLEVSHADCLKHGQQMEYSGVLKA